VRCVCWQKGLSLSYLECILVLEICDNFITIYQFHIRVKLESEPRFIKLRNLDPSIDGHRFVGEKVPKYRKDGAAVRRVADYLGRNVIPARNNNE
jgi:hypothetical protein